MSKLDHTLTSDWLFKLFFVKYPDLLKILVGELLKINVDDMIDFKIINPEIIPEKIGDKLCRLDIHMMVNNQVIDLEIQVKKHESFVERMLFYWSKDFSASLKKGENYSELPRVIIISIVDFPLFECDDFHTEFVLMERNNHIILTDKINLHFFELPKIQGVIDKTNPLVLWLLLFKAKTEEDLNELEKMEVSFMKQAVEGFKQVSESLEYRELQRTIELTEFYEATMIHEAKEKGRAEERAKFEKLIAEKDAEMEKLIAEKDAEIARLSKKNND